MRTIYSNSERPEQFLKQNGPFLLIPRDLSDVIGTVRIRIFLKMGLRKMQEK